MDGFLKDGTTVLKNYMMMILENKILFLDNDIEIHGNTILPAENDNIPKEMQEVCED